MEEKKNHNPAEEDPGATRVLTDELKEALSEQEEEAIIDAKISQGINEAADEFRNEQEQDRAGESIAEEVQQNHYYTNPDNTVGGYGTMENNYGKEEAEVKTVYVEKKQKTGWWKIVMLVLACVATVCLFLSTIFSAIRTIQLGAIAGNQMITYDYSTYGDDSWYEDGYMDDYSYGTDGRKEGAQGDGDYYYQEGGYDMSLDELMDLIRGFETYYNENYSNPNGNNNNANDNNANNNTNNNNNNPNPNSNQTPKQDSTSPITDWFEGIFG